MKLNSQTPQLNFQSRILVCSYPRFERFKKKLPADMIADHPWTVKEAVTGVRTLTEGVCDCSAVTIATKNGKSQHKIGTTTHLCPDEPQKNEIFPDFEQNVRSKLAGKPVSGVLVGSVSKENLDGQTYSENLFANVLQFCREKLVIPVSYFRGQQSHGIVHLAYDGERDTYLICKPCGDENYAYYPARMKKEIFMDSFDEIFIHPNDKKPEFSF